eukprot:CAMPEP_0198204690 /NCGR_PEP_ID=MMETSP1445-20131203/8126_1 /TAXON_ID=36898 /ORGANISM="Pyramimonas sp., Strain CCMP2087" /LENGTH=168 /DNA_ID=CAMNT_0043876683 /DNA_START=473 /DNA_END=975 /DNA_ORIENTATION=+
MRAASLSALFALLALAGTPSVASYQYGIPMSRRAERARRYALRTDPYVRFAKERPKEPPVDKMVASLNERFWKTYRFENHTQADAATWTEFPNKTTSLGPFPDYRLIKSGAFQKSLPLVVDQTSENSAVAQRIPQARVDMVGRGYRSADVARNIMEDFKHYQKKSQWS